MPPSGLLEEAPERCAAEFEGGHGGQQPKQRSHLSSVLQLTAMCLGPGLFTIPSVFAQLGILQSSIAVACIAVFADFAMQRLLDVAAEHGLSSYEALAQKALGAMGNSAMAAITLVTTFIASCSYLGASASLLVDVFAAFILDVNVNDGNIAVVSSQKQVVLLLALTFGVLPLWMSPTMGDKSWISSTGVGVMLVSIAFFLGYCILYLIQHGASSVPLATSSAQSFLENIATLAFSFSMIFAVFPTLEELSSDASVAETVPSVKLITKHSVALCASLYMFMGIIGSLSFGKDTKTIALQNLNLSQPLTQLAHLLVGMSLALNVAIISFPTVKSLELLCKSFCCARWQAFNMHPWLAAVIALAIVVVDSALPTKIAFALCGSLGLGFAAYIMPCILFLRLDSRSSWSSFQKAFVPLVLLFGMMLVFGSTPMTLSDLLHSSATSSIPLKDSLVKQWCKQGSPLLDMESSREAFNF